MTFSYSLVLALFLLAPGFAAFAGLFFSSLGERHVHPAPPAPTSVLTLALVTLAALALHAAWALLLLVQALWVANIGFIAVPFEPNIYLDLLNAGRLPPPGVQVGAGEIAAILATMVILSALGFGLTVRLVTSRWGERHLRTFLYGWSADLVSQINAEKPGYVRMVTAFVLTNIEHEGALFGYEGLLQNMALSPEKEITSVTLTQVTAFYVKLEPGRFKRIVLPRTRGIPNIYLGKDQIRNISFTVLRVRDTEVAALP